MLAAKTGGRLPTIEEVQQWPKTAQPPEDSRAQRFYFVINGKSSYEYKDAVHGVGVDMKSYSEHFVQNTGGRDYQLRKTECTQATIKAGTHSNCYSMDDIKAFMVYCGLPCHLESFSAHAALSIDRNNAKTRSLGPRLAEANVGTGTGLLKNLSQCCSKGFLSWYFHGRSRVTT